MWAVDYWTTRFGMVGCVWKVPVTGTKDTGWFIIWHHRRTSESKAVPTIGDRIDRRPVREEKSWLPRYSAAATQ